LKVFFDNCTSPVLASTLDGFIRHRGHSAHHIRTLPCGASADDIAFRQMMLKGFALSPAYQRTPIQEVASLLIWRWLQMEELMSLVAAPALYELPISRAAKFRPLPL
jgi:hypothetical protein